MGAPDPRGLPSGNGRSPRCGATPDRAGPDVICEARNHGTPPADYPARRRRGMTGPFNRGNPRPLPLDSLSMWWKRYLSNFTMGKEGGCWEWQGTIVANGYGRFEVDGVPYFAHRIMAAVVAGVDDIPPGIEPDHVCRNKRCVNPTHLELVTFSENMSRRPSCRKRNQAGMPVCGRGHALEDENRYVAPDGRAFCRACNRAASSRYHARKRGAA